MVRYDTGLNKNVAATGLYYGYMEESAHHARHRSGVSGHWRTFWASGRTKGATIRSWRCKTPGQIVNGGFANPIVVDMVTQYVYTEPLTQSNDWMAIPLDSAFVMDMVSNPENKGFVVDNYAAGLVCILGQHRLLFQRSSR